MVTQKTKVHCGLTLKKLKTLLTQRNTNILVCSMLSVLRGNFDINRFLLVFGIKVLGQARCINPCRLENAPSLRIKNKFLNIEKGSVLGS